MSQCNSCEIRFAIGIATFGRDQVLLDTLNQVIALAPLPDEIIVVDQTEHELDIASSIENLCASFNINYLRQATPSLTAARNTILRETKSDVVIFIDDDVILPQDFVHRHAENYIENSKIVAVAGAVNQRLGWPKVKRPQQWPRALDYRYFDLENSRKTYNIANFIGANHSVRVEAARAVGGYDQELRGVALREDSDMALRLYRSGGNIVFDPLATLIHLQVPTGGCRPKNPRDVSAARSNLIFCFRHAPLLGHHIFREIWHSLRISVLNRKNINKPIQLLECSALFGRALFSAFLAARRWPDKNSIQA